MATGCGCRLSGTAHRRTALAIGLDRETATLEDRVVIHSVGYADDMDLRVESLGKMFRQSNRKPG
jgi:CRISPR-associated protein Cas2